MQPITAHEAPLFKIFSNDYDFRIPDYQRPYAWEPEQAGQLLDDLVEALDRDPGDPYFLGSVVLVKSPESPHADVIDGQQRLTTLTILFAVLRHLTTDTEAAAELDRLILEPGAKLMGLDAKPRLALRQRDRTFFRTYVQESGGLVTLLAMNAETLVTDAQRCMQRNAKVLLDQLQNRSEDDRLRLATLLVRRTYLVAVSTPDLHSAHRIFSVMNSRGLDLSPADIFKADVIGAVDEGASQEYTDKWEDAEETLGRDDFSDLFLHVRMIYTKERARRELLHEFPEKVLSAFLPDKAREFVDDVVVPYADAYEDVRDSNYAASPGAATPEQCGRVNAWFTRLSGLDNSDWKPAALWAMRHHKDDPDFLDAFHRRLERLSASMLIRREYTTPRVNRFVELLKQLDEGHGLDAAAFDLSDLEKEETIERLNGDLYLSLKVRKYVLLRLDEELAGESGVVYSHPIITVEHVLPQTPDKSSPWVQNFTEDERSLWTHRLANLVLLDRRKNSEAQNYDFQKKKQIYFTSRSSVSTFAITSQVLAETAWTTDVLQRRQRDLLGRLRSAWSL